MSQPGRAIQGPIGPTYYDIEFVGGPLDGHNPVDSAANRRLMIEGDVSGYYEYMQGRYHWVPAQSKS